MNIFCFSFLVLLLSERSVLFLSKLFSFVKNIFLVSQVRQEVLSTSFQDYRVVPFQHDDMKLKKVEKETLF